MEKLLWKFEAIAVLACYEKLKSRFTLIGRSTLFPYTTLFRSIVTSISQTGVVVSEI